MEINTNEIEATLKGWETILCSISSAKKNGKVTNRKTWVNREKHEKCIKSFLESFGEKLTNFELGKVDIYWLELKEEEPNTVRLTEYLSDGTVGVVKFFSPVNEEGVWVYKLSEEHNIHLNK
ncbi:MAG: hypothetical protein ACRC6E_09305 [Fusobacteriaceae bacterium]